MQTVDPKLIDFVFAGRRLNEGLGDGTWAEVTPEAELYNVKVGVDGTVVRTPVYNALGTVKLTLMYTSAVNQFLSNLVAQDRLSRNQGLGGSSVGAFSIIDRGGATLIFASKAWPKKLPSVTFSAEPETCDWEFTLADMVPIIGGTVQD